MKLSVAVITDNSEKWIGKVIKRLQPYMDYAEDMQFIFIDNRSTDDTVPQIVALINTEFTNEERFKFYINTSKKTIEECEAMVGKIASSENCVIIKKNINKKQLERAIKEAIK